MKNITIKKDISGITLIALVVTVIVLVILAGITFSALLGDDQTLKVARNEANTAKKTIAREKIKLEVAGSKKIDGKYVAGNIKSNILAHIENSDVLKDDFPLIATVDGYTFLIDSNGRVIEANFYYLVQFDGNGATGIMNSQEFQRDEEKKLEANKFIREGYTFAGWNTDPNGNGTGYEDEQLVKYLMTEEYGVKVLYAQWLRGVSEIDGVHYDTLQDAIDAVPTNNVRKTVKLLTNTKENITIPANKNILFDLQNYTINVRDYGSLAVVENRGTIEITNGTIKSDSRRTAVINNYTGGKITISSGRILMEDTAGKQALYNDGGTVEITGTAYLSSASLQGDAGDNVRATVQNQANSTLNITGGTIISINYNGIQNNGTMTIGKKDGQVNINSPVIRGANVGINCTSNFNFYDGIAKGKANPINDLSYIADRETGFLLGGSNEIIAGEKYKTAYLSIKVTVTFDPNGGNVDKNSEEVDSGKTVGDLGDLPIPTRNGYEFVGWFTERNGGVLITAETKIDSAITFYAHWLEAYTVTFNPNGGTVEEKSRQVSKGRTIGTLPVPNRDKYDFTGWYTKSSGGEEITAETIINSNITYYAHWEKIMYAEINGKQYETIAKAISAVPKDGTETTVELTRDTNENFTIQSGQNIILDLKNNTLNTSKNAAVIENNGTLTVKSGTIASTEATGTINNNKGATLIIDGARITGKERSAIYNNSGGRVEIRGDSYLSSSATGQINGQYRAAVHNLSGGTITITGGTIVGIEQQAVTNLGTMIIGTSGNLDTTTPVFISKTYGIKTTGTLEFYDGIVKGITGGISGTITKQEPNTQMASATEVIDGVTYKTNYLQSIQ